MVTAILFDIGNVLLPFDFGSAIRKLAAQIDVPPEKVFDLVIPVKDLYESGKIGRKEFLDRATEMLGYRGAIDDFVVAWQDIFTVNAPLHSLVEKLSARYPLYLLSNTSDLHMEHVTATYPVFEKFSAGVYSHLAGSLKPDRAIFETAIRELKIVPAQTVFVDDLPDNIATANAMGFRGIVYDFRDHAALERALREEHAVEW